MFTEIEISPTVKADFDGVRIFGIELEIEKQNIDCDFDSHWQRLAKRWFGKSKAEVAADETIASYNDFFRMLGLNVKKSPPSSQNLIQRFLIKNNKGYPKINPIVDVVNIAAVDSLIPLGVFDANSVEGPLRLAFSAGDEAFLPLGAREPVTLDAGKLVLKDDVKVLSEFGIRDGQAQMITDASSRIWLLGCLVPGISEAQVKSGMQMAYRLLTNNDVN
ncbi:hypothetical protein SG34_029835 [Thalassomonas viridans]|uniref:B3/B4 tRNA-binding domain-containing protein n=1 Tax=Thalassomonas viridans TaxID=137584 RepID=A0AAF0CEY9_9GAMM|nr:phenylalanine--tRNA ligase beta subunit-related protein [Thalassomonas viridans]WDE08984.1 hypothetical protein SG34_029835 [Thalassomonas viridans]